MKRYVWNREKNQRLKTERSISLEEALIHIATGDILNIFEHRNQEKYEAQRIFIIPHRPSWLRIAPRRPVLFSTLHLKQMIFVI